MEHISQSAPHHTTLSTKSNTITNANKSARSIVVKQIAQHDVRQHNVPFRLSDVPDHKGHTGSGSQEHKDPNHSGARVGSWEDREGTTSRSYSRCTARVLSPFSVPTSTDLVFPSRPGSSLVTLPMTHLCRGTWSSSSSTTDPSVNLP